jgi:hypothetical protein
MAFCSVANKQTNESSNHSVVILVKKITLAIVDLFLFFVSNVKCYVPFNEPFSSVCDVDMLYTFMFSRLRGAHEF